MLKIALKYTINKLNVQDGMPFYTINSVNFETLNNALFTLLLTQRSNRKTYDDRTLESQCPHNNQYIPRRWN